MLNRKITAAALITTIMTTNAMALPQGGVVTNGSATIATSGNTMNVNQTTSRADINWNSFNLGKADTVNFNSANRSDITINKVVGGSPSLIQGMLNSNHTVAILNDAGMTFTKDAKVNVGALITATAKNYQFINDKLILSNFGAGSIKNYGNIKTAEYGQVGIFANNIANYGNITANLGLVQLANGKEATVTINGFNYRYTDDRNITANDTLVSAGILNEGVIKAGGGTVLLSTKQVQDIRTGAINLKGVIDVSSITPEGSLGYSVAAGVVQVNASGNLTTTGTVKAVDNHMSGYSSGVISLSSKATNDFRGNIKAGSAVNDGYPVMGNSATYIKGKDVIFAGKVNAGSNPTMITDLHVDSETGFTIKDGARGTKVEKNVLFEKDLEGISKNADVRIHGTKLVVNNLKDNKLDMQNGLHFSNYKAYSQYDGTYGDSIYTNGSFSMLAKKDTLKANGLGLDVIGDVKMGNIESTSYAYVTGKKIDAMNISGGYSTYITSQGGDINVGNVKNLGNYASISSNGGNITANNIELQGSAPLGGFSTTTSFNINSKNTATGAAGDIKVADILVSSTPNLTGYTATTNAELQGNNISFGNVQVRNNAGTGYAGSNADFQVIAKGNINVNGNINVVNKTDKTQPTKPLSGARINLVAGDSIVTNGQDLNARSVNNIGLSNGGYETVNLSAGKSISVGGTSAGPSAANIIGGSATINSGNYATINQNAIVPISWEQFAITQ